MTQKNSAFSLSKELGARLKQARLNQNLTQLEVSERAGLSRKTILNAEKGKVYLDAFVAILLALDLEDQLDLMLPPQIISPIQLSKMQGKKRQRASGSPTKSIEGESQW